MSPHWPVRFRFPPSIIIGLEEIRFGSSPTPVCISVGREPLGEVSVVSYYYFDGESGSKVLAGF
jgi:hypothetical protein